MLFIDTERAAPLPWLLESPPTEEDIAEFEVSVNDPASLGSLRKSRNELFTLLGCFLAFSEQFFKTSSYDPPSSRLSTLISFSKLLNSGVLFVLSGTCPLTKMVFSPCLNKEEKFRQST